MFASIDNVDPFHLRDFLVILAFLLSLAVNAFTLIQSRQSQKREVTLAADFATRDQVLESQQRTAETLALQREEIAELRTAITRLHTRIDELERDLGTMPDRVIAQLVNTLNLVKLGK